LTRIRTYLKIDFEAKGRWDRGSNISSEEERGKWIASIARNSFQPLADKRNFEIGSKAI
jgi:hypothetical protein